MKKKILAAIGYVFLFLLAINVVVTVFVPEKSMEYLGYRSLLVLSDSMEPEIELNDLVVIISIDEENIEVGDIITFSVYIPELREEAFVTHYVAAIEENELGETIYKTHGAQAEPDVYDQWRDAEGNSIDITFEDIEGQYFFHVGFVGDIIVALRNPIFLAMIVITITMVGITINYIRNTRNDDDEDEEESENKLVDYDE